MGSIEQDVIQGKSSRQSESGRDAVIQAGGPLPGLAALMDELAHAVVVTTEKGRIIHANHAGRHELVRASVIGLWKGGLVQASRPECDRDLKAALSRAATGLRSFIQLGAMEGAGLFVAVVPLKPCGGNEPRCAIVFSRGSICEPLMLAFFARRHRITAAEEVVLSGLCAGQSAPQIASRLRVAVSTVRSHVRSICVKTRAKSVREIVQRLAVLPPFAPAFPHEPVH
jgi:DNA-binding CsgD family transcriptional regulator